MIFGRLGNIEFNILLSKVGVLATLPKFMLSKYKEYRVVGVGAKPRTRRKS